FNWGARTGQSDLFFEVDYMPPVDDGGIPWLPALQKIVDVFAAGGVAVHFDVGDLFHQAAGISLAEFDLGGGNEVPAADGAGFGFGDVNPVDPGEADVRAYKTQFMDVRRKPVFHYMLFASRLTESGCSGFWGLAEVTGNEIIICMGGYGLNSDTTTATNYLLNYQAGVVFHEIGHNLSLHHGGFEGRNFKPNYISSMNYLYGGGLPTIGNDEGDRYYLENFPGNVNCGGYQSSNELTNPPSGDPAFFLIDYSNGLGAPLDESSVNENGGLGRTNSQGVDYNCDGVLDPTGYSLNLNPAFSETSNEVLDDYNDWANLDFIFQRNIWDDLF
ncbi:MAG: hypothetical protein IIA14_12910, partial [SAR324 cluster bacterium]|nr:hypothetical protein [SAR324 cluster bacterium]